MDPTPSTPETADWTSIEQLCDRYVEGRPSPAILQILKPLEQERREVRDFTRRVLRLMAISHVGARNVSPMAAFSIAMSRNLLPGAMGGKIPPITAPGRLKVIDDYISMNPWNTFGTGTVMIELGCGFPPTTAVDTSQRFKEWQIVGADPSFHPYILYDRDQSYATLDQDGQIQYFQLLPTASAKSMEDFIRLRGRIPELFAQLVPMLPAENGEMFAAETDGSRLIRWPLKQWESPNLRLIQAGIGTDALPKADVIRCFNVLMYYDTRFLREFETWVASQVQEKGLVIAGANSPNGSEACYCVYQKEGGRLVERELSISVDIIRPLGIMPWFSLHDDNASNLRLAHLVRRIRSDGAFCTEFDNEMDLVLQQSGLLIRDDDGCLASPPVQMPFEKMLPVMSGLGDLLDRAGLTSSAAEALARQGVRAWRNEVGHLAVDPATLPSGIHEDS